jgi:cold shock CspA family protein
MHGLVKNLVQGKNFGFIRGEDGKTEYFFHREDFAGFWDDLVTDWQRGKNSHIAVEFDVVNSPKGIRAAHVRRLDHPNQGT